MKKYVPSGYQIINIDLTGKTSGTPFTPETEDEKLLHEILSSGELKKPILLDITTSSYHVVGFVVYYGDISITFGAVGSSVTEEISLDDDKLQWVETEE